MRAQSRFERGARTRPSEADLFHHILPVRRITDMPQIRCDNSFLIGAVCDRPIPKTDPEAAPNLFSVLFDNISHYS